MRDFLFMAIEWLGVSLGLAILAWRVAVAVQAARDARGRGWSRLASAGWALSALVHGRWYWWQARLKRMSQAEARTVLAEQAAVHRLASVANLRCPLCDTEIENALSVTAAGVLAVHSPARCPRCDFRLDACRHCRHFLPAEDNWGGQKDFTTGRCGLYRAPQPVREAFPQIAARLEAMGYDTLNAPKRIVDSYVPLDDCRGFALDQERLKVNRIAWINQQRSALIQLRQTLLDQG